MASTPKRTSPIKRRYRGIVNSVSSSGRIAPTMLIAVFLEIRPRLSALVPAVNRNSDGCLNPSLEPTFHRAFRRTRRNEHNVAIPKRDIGGLRAEHGTQIDGHFRLTLRCAPDQLRRLQ